MNHSHEEHSCCRMENQKKRPWYLRFLTWTIFASLILLGLSFVFSPLEHFRHSFAGYMHMMAWPIVLGLLIGGLMDYYVPQEYVSKYLARKTKRTVFYAAGLGFLMSACSHGILALSMELHKKGASGPAVISFLLASPWANLPITFLLLGFFGWKGLMIILTALLISISTGLIFQILDEKNWIEKNRHTAVTDQSFSIRKDVARRMRAYRFSAAQLGTDLKGVGKGIAGLADMVLGWVLVGVILAGLAGALVPQGIFERFFGPSFTGLLVTMALAAVLEVCSEGTSPLAFELYQKTGAFGNAFAFLMGGVVTDYTEIGLVWMNIGRKTAVWMLIITIPQVILAAAFFNWIF